MTRPHVVDALAPRQRRSLQAVVALASGLLVMFVAFGFGAWFSGAASWVGFYLGARGRMLAGLAQVTTCVGFAIAVVVTLAWYWRRFRNTGTCKWTSARLPTRAPACGSREVCRQLQTSFASTRQRSSASGPATSR